MQKNEKESKNDRNRIARKNKKKVCNFCLNKAENIDYKDIPKLKRFMTERAKIMPRRVTGVCSSHQRKLTIAIKRARHIALLPYINE